MLIKNTQVLNSILCVEPNCEPVTCSINELDCLSMIENCSI